MLCPCLIQNELGNLISLLRSPEIGTTVPVIAPQSPPVNTHADKQVLLVIFHQIKSQLLFIELFLKVSRETPELSNCPHASRSVP